MRIFEPQLTVSKHVSVRFPNAHPRVSICTRTKVKFLANTYKRDGIADMRVNQLFTINYAQLRIKIPITQRGSRVCSNASMSQGTRSTGRWTFWSRFTLD